ncbi:MAG TPA: hypothetical protein VEO01_16795 [Pseudonocardiaceae bacterium]|nr:hypothetical protein [Pseudonocardiaceae bacterium]
MSFLTGTNCELIYANDTAFTAKNTFTTEVTIDDQTGGGPAAFLPQGFVNYSRKGLRIEARGILSSTGTPTYTLTLRSGTIGNITAAILLGSAALTTATTITNKGWEFEGSIIFKDPSGSGAASSGTGAGMITCPAGLASPFTYELWGGAAQPGSFSTFDPTIQNFLNFNVACSASSASNSIQLLEFLVYGLN